MLIISQYHTKLFSIGQNDIEILGVNILLTNLLEDIRWDFYGWGSLMKIPIILKILIIE